MRILQRLQTHTTDTFLFISHTTNVLLFKFRCNIFIGVRIIKEMPGSVASVTPCICMRTCSFAIAASDVTSVSRWLCVSWTDSVVLYVVQFVCCSFGTIWTCFPLFLSFFLFFSEASRRFKVMFNEKRKCLHRSRSVTSFCFFQLTAKTRPVWSTSASLLDGVVSLTKDGRRLL